MIVLVYKLRRLEEQIIFIFKYKPFNTMPLYKLMLITIP